MLKRMAFYSCNPRRTVISHLAVGMIVAGL